MTDYYDVHGQPMTIDQWTAERSDEENGMWQQAHRRTSVTDDIGVSTVWLGLDHQWGDGPPLIFETMVFGGNLDQHQVRYSTLEEAHAGHEAMVAQVRSERDTFHVIADSPDVVAAVRLLEREFKNHRQRFDLDGYEDLYEPLLKVIEDQTDG